MDKYIFLDFDGVLNTSKYIHSNKERFSQIEDRTEWSIAKLDPSLIKNLNKITDQTGAKIVITSSWRINRTLDELITILRGAGVTGDIVGKTDKLHEPGYKIPRGSEIEKWLIDNGIKPHKFNSYVIIDDDTDMLYNQRNNFFNTDWEFGLGKNYAYRIINFLNAVK